MKFALSVPRHVLRQVPHLHAVLQQKLFLLFIEPERIENYPDGRKKKTR
jgi:hypothetical protein